MNKKIILALLVAALSFSIAGCKTISINFNDDTSSSASSSVSTTSSDSSSTTSSDNTKSTSSTNSDDKSNSSTTSSLDNSSNSSNTSNQNNQNTQPPNNSEDKSPNVTVNITNDYGPLHPTIPQTRYYSNSFIFPESSSVYLSKNQVASLSNYELGIARNEIYARHGYTFDLAQFRNYFNSQAWYTPIGKNVSLSKLEEYNVGLIKAEENRRGVKW